MIGVIVHNAGYSNFQEKTRLLVNNSWNFGLFLTQIYHMDLEHMEYLYIYCDFASFLK